METRKNQGLFGKGLIATFQLSSAASLNLGRFQNGVLRNGLTHHHIILTFNFPDKETF